MIACFKGTDPVGIDEMFKYYIFVLKCSETCIVNFDMNNKLIVLFYYMFDPTSWLFYCIICLIKKERLIPNGGFIYSAPSDTNFLIIIFVTLFSKKKKRKTFDYCPAGLKYTVDKQNYTFAIFFYYLCVFFPQGLIHV